MSQNREVLEKLSQKQNASKINEVNLKQILDVSDKPKNIFFNLVIILVLLSVIAGGVYCCIKQENSRNIELSDVIPPSPKSVAGLTEFNLSLDAFKVKDWDKNC